VNPKRSLTGDRPILDLPYPTPTFFVSTSHTSEFPSGFLLPAFHLLSHSDSYSGSKPGFLSYRHLSPLLRERPLKSPTPGGPFSHTWAWAHAHALRGLHPSLWDLHPRPSIESVPSPDSCGSHIEHWWAVTSAYSFLPHTHTHIYTHTLSWCAEARSHQTADVNYQSVFRGLYLQSLPETAVSPAVSLCCSDTN